MLYKFSIFGVYGVYILCPNHHLYIKYTQNIHQFALCDVLHRPQDLAFIQRLSLQLPDYGGKLTRRLDKGVEPVPVDDLVCGVV